MTPLPRLETPRLVLRVPEPDDAERLCAFVTRNQQHLAPWEPLHTAEYFTAAHWRDRLAAQLELVERGAAVPFMIQLRESPEEVIGNANFSNIVRGPFQAAFLGYGLGSEFEGHGLMHEALEAAITYCFDTLHLHRIMANYIPTNERSGRLLRRLGFDVEGYARDYLQIAGSWQDHVLTALTNPRWTPRAGGKA